jgi:hypothetical protein
VAPKAPEKTRDWPSWASHHPSSLDCPRMQGSCKTHRKLVGSRARACLQACVELLRPLSWPHGSDSLMGQRDNKQVANTQNQVVEMPGKRDQSPRNGATETCGGGKLSRTSLWDLQQELAQQAVAQHVQRS